MGEKMAVDYNLLLNPSEILEKSLPKLIEVFADFYGEERRKRIEEKFNNMLLIGYHSTNSIGHILNNIYRQKQMELINEFVENEHLKLSPEERKFLENINLASSDTPDFLKANESAFADIKYKFANFKSIYAEYESFQAETERVEEIIINKYNQKLLEDFANLLSEKQKNMIINNIASGQFQSLVGDIVEGVSLIQFFSKENSEKLNNSHIKESEKQSIKKARVWK